MKRSTLLRSIVEAKRYIVLAETAIKTNKQAENEEYLWWSSKENAAAKRASMDLTRTLADLRQGR